MKKVVIYTRVSTDEQKENGFSLQDQEAKLRKECARLGYEIIAHYQDDFSAKTFNRPCFQKFYRELKAKVIRPDIFMVARWDRFSRNTVEALNMYFDLQKRSVTVVSLENNVELNSPEALLPFVFHMAMPQIDNDRRGLNTKNGMRQAKKEGRWMGTAPFGYINNKITKLIEIDPKEAEVVRTIFKQYSAGGISVEAIRQSLKKEGVKFNSKQSLINILRNKAYIGKVEVPGTKEEPEQLIDGLHDPIIDQDTFYKAQEILSGKSRPYYLTRKDDLVLQGLMICPNCGHPLTGSTSKGNGGHYSYYHCQPKHHCGFPRVRAQVANQSFEVYLEQLQPKKATIELYKAILEDVFNCNEVKQQQQRKSLEEEIDKVNKRLEDLIELRINGELNANEFQEVKRRYEEKRHDLTGKHISLVKMPSQFNRYLNYGLSLVGNISKYYSQATVENKRRIVSSIFPEKLVYSDNSYRTTKVNEVFALLCSPGAALNEKQPYKSVKLSIQAPPVGLEPTTL